MKKTPQHYNLKITVDPDGVPFDIIVRDFETGESFFLPCLNVAEAKRQVTAKLMEVGFKVRGMRMQPAISNGLSGLRVWKWR